MNKPYVRPATPDPRGVEKVSYPIYLKIHLYPNRHERRRMAKLMRRFKG